MYNHICTHIYIYIYLVTFGGNHPFLLRSFPAKMMNAYASILYVFGKQY